MVGLGGGVVGEVVVIGGVVVVGLGGGVVVVGEVVVTGGVGVVVLGGVVVGVVGPPPQAANKGKITRTIATVIINSFLIFPPYGFVQEGNIVVWFPSTPILFIFYNSFSTSKHQSKHQVPQKRTMDCEYPCLHHRESGNSSILLLIAGQLWE